MGAEFEDALTAIAAKQDIIDMHDQVRINIVPAVVARRNIGICERLAPPLLRECLLLRLAVLLLVRRAHVRRTIRVLRLGCHGLPRPLPHSNIRVRLARHEAVRMQYLDPQPGRTSQITNQL